MQLVAVRRAMSQDGMGHRLLSRDGMYQSQRVAAALAEQFPKASLLLTSPSMRAVQTATLIGDRLGLVPEEFAIWDKKV
jgi:phosphohistidine phosphatase SixA